MSPGPGRFERVVTQRFAERVGRGLAWVPPVLRERIGPTPFFEGDVVFAGLMEDFGTYEAEMGGRLRTYRYTDSALCHWQLDPAPWAWISMPHGADRQWDGTVLHEIGHALWNRTARRHARRRVYAEAGPGSVTVRENSGLIPPALTFSTYAPGDVVEQFAEAFRIWLSPGEALAYPGEAERFYIEREGVAPWGFRWSNRGLLAFLNELAGLPADTPPVALRDRTPAERGASALR